MCPEIFGTGRAITEMQRSMTNCARAERSIGRAWTEGRVAYKGWALRKLVVLRQTGPSPLSVISSHAKRNCSAWLPVVATVLGIAFLSSSASAAITAKAKKAPLTNVRPTPPELTRVTVQLNIPFNRITKIINQFDFKAQSKGIANVYLVGGVRYEGAGSLGNVMLSASSDQRFPIRLKAPFRWVGTIGIFDVRADGELTIDFGIRVGTDWCPLAEFGEPIIELYPDKAINLANVPYAKTVIRDAIASELKKQVNCNSVQKTLAELWQVQTTPLTIGGKTFVLNMKPETVGLTDVIVVDGRLVLKASLGLSTILSSRPIPFEKAKLPPPERNSSSASQSDGEIEIGLSLKLGLGFQ
jgi:hypothetical protein